MTTGNQPVDMAQVGPAAWAKLHAWADEFKAASAGACGCGDFAVAATRAIHDIVNTHLGKPVLYRDNLQRFAEWAQGAATQVRAAQGFTGAVVMVEVPRRVAERLFVGHEPPGNMHITVGYMGEASDISGSTRGQILDAVSQWASHQRPFDVVVKGTKRFPVGPNSDGKEPYVALVHGAVLPRVHNELGVLLEPLAPFSKAYSYTPHITLAYLVPDAPPSRWPDLEPEGIEFEVEDIIVSFAGEQHRIDLGGTGRIHAAQSPATFSLAFMESLMGAGVGPNLRDLPVEERRRIWAARKRGQRAKLCPHGQEIHHPDYSDPDRYECVTPKAHRDRTHLSQAFMERVMAIPKEQIGFGDEWMKDDGPTGDPVKVVDRRDDARYKLFPYQAEGVKLLSGRTAAILADQPGLGKTSQAIVWAAPHRPVLVIAPSSLVYNWEIEIKENWRRNDTVRVVDVNSPWSDDLSDWTIVSFGQVQTLQAELRRAKFETLLIDEAHSIRNWDTDRTQAIMNIVDPPTDRSPKYRLLITGTPVVNTEEDILSYLVVLGIDAVREMGIDPSSVGLTLHQWLDSARRVFNKAERYPGEKDALRRQWQAALQKIMVRRMKADVLKDLPPKSHTLLPVALTNAGEYERAEQEFQGYIRDQTGRKVSSAVALQKLSALRALSALGKVDAVADYLKGCDNGGEKTIVFSSHIEPLERLQEMRGGLLYTGDLSKSTRQEYVEKFQKGPAGSACFFLGTYGAAGVGITLTAAHRVVLLDLPWTPADKQQAEDRAHRIGQKQPVQIVTVIGKNTIDERVLEILSTKEQLIGQIVDGMSAGDASQASIAGDVLKRVRKQEWGQGSRRVPRYVGDGAVMGQRRKKRNDNEGDPNEVLYRPTRQRGDVIAESSAPSDLDLFPSEYAGFRVDSRLVRDPAYDPSSQIVLNSGGVVQPLFAKLRNSDREHLVAFYLDVGLHLIGTQVVTIGERSATQVNTDALLRAAILSNASAIILAHNHPSGDETPSSEDRLMLGKLQNSTCGALAGIRVLDLWAIGSTHDYSISSGGRFAAPLSQVEKHKWTAEDDPSLLPGALPWPDRVPRAIPVTPARRQPALFEKASASQIRDSWGSRCRDPEGHWTFKDFCGPLPASVPTEPTHEPETFAIGPTGITRYELRHRLVDARTLIVSNDPFTFEPNPAFPSNLQPRMRTRAANQEQVKTMAARLAPDALLVDFHSIDRGSPIIGADLVVESGNGRVMALVLAEREHPGVFERYVDALAEILPEYGISADGIQGLGVPVLVRERLTEVDRRQFVEEANGRSTLSASAVETARADAEKITVDMLFDLNVLEKESMVTAIKAARNRPFVARFIAKLPPQDQAAIADSKGDLSVDGVRRVAMAIFVRAFPGEAGLMMAERNYESTDEEVRASFNGIGMALGALVKSEALVASGARDKGFAIADDIAAAVNVQAKIRATPGLDVPKYLSQQQLTERELTPFQERVLAFLDNKKRSAKAIALVLTAYANGVIAVPPPAQEGLFGPLATASKESLWGTAVREGEGVATPQPQLEPALAMQAGKLFQLPDDDATHRQGIYYRYQPVGLPLMGSHRSMVGGEGQHLPRGFTFAFHTVGQVLHGALAESREPPDATEIIVFRGRDEYQPGDVEGWVVRPTLELARFLLADVDLYYKNTQAPHPQLRPPVFEQPAMVARGPKSRVDWCNMTDAEIDRVWGWKPLREALLTGTRPGEGRTASVCHTGFTDDAYQVTVKTWSIPSQDQVVAAYDKLKGRAKRVPNWGHPNDYVYEIILPPLEDGAPLFRPQEAHRERREALAPQAALFQSSMAARRKVIPASAYSDFRLGTDKVIRKDGRTYIHDNNGEYADVEVASDAMPAEFVERFRAMSEDQRRGMIQSIRGTHLLSDEGRRERIRALEEAGLIEPLFKVIARPTQPALFQPKLGTPPDTDDDDEGEDDVSDHYGTRAPWGQGKRVWWIVSRRGGDKSGPFASKQAALDYLSEMGMDKQLYWIQSKAEQHSVSASSPFLDFLLNGAAGAIGATLGATIMSKVLGGSALAVTSPEAAIRVVDDREPAKGGGDPSAVVNPGHVEGDQAQVDVGSLLVDLNAILNDPSKWGEVNPDTVRVVREGAA